MQSLKQNNWPSQSETDSGQATALKLGPLPLQVAATSASEIDGCCPVLIAPARSAAPLAEAMH